MPFSESKESPNDFTPRKPASESVADYESERNERRRQEALAYLIETGRAKTPEEAERHLESLNRLKERLVLILRDIFADNVWARTRPDRPGDVLIGNPILDERSPATAISLAEIDPNNIDTSDPNIWELQRNITSISDASTYWENLFIPMKTGNHLAITASGFVPTLLGRHLYQEDLHFLHREYGFACQDLAKRIRKEGDKIADRSATRQFVSPDGWPRLFRSVRNGTVDSLL